MTMELSQFKTYKVFSSEEEVKDPFEHVKTLSNGDKIGKTIYKTDIEGTLTNEEVKNYIKLNHTEPSLDE